MNKYILLIGVAGVALGSYCAMASNSATMTVTATIAHDVSLSVTHDLNMGIITINPGADWSLGGMIYLNSDGTVNQKSTNVISVTGFSIGTFTANVPDSCKVDGVAHSGNSYSQPCFEADGNVDLGNTFVYEPWVKYVSGNTFRFMYDFWGCDDGVIPTSGNYSGSITIKYVL
ncbi:MAG: hypothetical protein IJ689_01140 [Alphaproteobacteria bacterium]|nr:hypothetical protein [Alphaproteobacteria bacterium]